VSHLVIARKYRPLGFAAVSGQEHVTRTLANSIARDKIAHAYLFCGPRGVGKTSIARIFAKALNCQSGNGRPVSEPCLECVNCREIAQGSSMAVREIDGASHNSVDNVRDLIDSFRSAPAPGSLYKIYIIDEVHMLSTSAFNALLKSLEEPPPHTVFILATTEVHKIPETVISRCQRHDFRALTLAEIEKRLRAIVTEEGGQIEDDALRMIARVADGSMRDSQSLLERVIAFCDGAVTVKETAAVLGVVERTVLITLSSMILSHRANEALAEVAKAFSAGIDPGLFLKEFVLHWRDLLIARAGGVAALTACDVSPSVHEDLNLQVQGVELLDLQDLADVARVGADSALRSSYPRQALEALVVRMASRQPVVEIGSLIASALSAGSGAGGSARSQTTSQATARPVVASPVAVAIEATTQVITAPVKELDWAEFVAHVGNSRARVMAENLKRLTLTTFAMPQAGRGVLDAAGPSFYVKALESSEERTRLQELLVQWSGVAVWEVRFKVVAETKTSDSQAVDTSLADRERAVHHGQQAQAKRDAAEHPNVKALTALFPGSKIETIKVTG